MYVHIIISSSLSNEHHSQEVLVNKNNVKITFSFSRSAVTETVVPSTASAKNCDDGFAEVLDSREIRLYL